MSRKAPGKSHRKGISLVDLMRRWPDDAAAEAWFVERRWPDGIACPSCGSDNVQTGAKHKTMPYRCREQECGKRFSPKTGTVMEGSKLGLQAWMIATYLITTSLKSVSSMKLHCDLNINQRTAWFLAHRLRETMGEPGGLFHGPVEVDETCFGGHRKNMSNAKRKLLKNTGRGAVGTAAVVGAKDCATNKVAAKALERNDTETLQGFVVDKAAPDATVYTDDSSAYTGMPFDHETVKHSLSEYVRDAAHTNGIESLWSMMKRAHKGTFHKISPKHLDPLRSGIGRAEQSPRGRHGGHDGGDGRRHGGQAPPLPGVDRRQRAGVWSAGMTAAIADDLSARLGDLKFGTILADPPWRFANRTGKIAPEHHRLSRYDTLSFAEIAALPVANYAAEVAHCYLWVPNALLPYGLNTLEAWGFNYKTNLIWHKIRKDGGPDGRGVGFYFRNVTEVILFGGARGKMPARLNPAEAK